MSSSREWPLRITTAFVCRECFPAGSGLLPHVIRLIDRYLDEFLDQRVLERACEGGADVSTLEFLLAFTAPDWRQAAKAAARGGHLHVLEWMLADRLDGRGPWRLDFELAPGGAAACGHLAVLQWLIMNNVGHLSSDTMDKAAAEGHLEIVQWLSQHYPKTLSLQAIRSAAEHGHLGTVQWLYEHVPESTSPAVMISAAHSGRLEVVEWLYQNQCTRGLDDALALAAAGGHLEIVQWLYDRGARSSSRYTIDSAAGSGNLELVKWFHGHFPHHFTAGAIDRAARYGHVDVVKWLHENRSDGCTTAAMNFAARLGQLDLVKWLHENRHEGCTTDAMEWAAEAGHLHVVQWLYSHRSEGCTNKAMIQAAFEGHVGIVCFLYDNNINRFFDEEVRNAVHRGRLEMFQLIVAKRGIGLLGGYSVERRICACVEEMLRGVQPRERTDPPQLADRNHPLRRVVEALAWFHRHGHFYCVFRMLLSALDCGYPTVVQSFFQPESDDAYLKYLELSLRFRCRTLTRWHLENAPQSAIHRAVELTGFLSNAEVMRWVSESDRARVVCDAIRGEWRGWQELLHWTFKHITFTDPASRRAIRDTIQDAPEDMAQWLRAHISPSDGVSWCFSSE